MDKLTSVFAATGAGKMPSQAQANALVDALLQSELLQPEQAARGGQLSASGQQLARDARHVLEAYKAYGSAKNEDDVLQQALWHLAQADVAGTGVRGGAPGDRAGAARDARALAAALRASLEVLWAGAAAEGGGVFSDFASFVRLSLADVAQAAAARAGEAAEALRGVEGEVQEGGRDALGRRRRSAQEAEAEADPKVRWEKGMDTAKVAGLKVIGAGQESKAKAEDLAQRSKNSLQQAAVKIAKHAQENEDYRQSLDTIFSLIQKWIKLAEDTAEGTAESTSLESFIQDPTEEKHLIKALHCIRKFAENVAGGKSLDGVFSSLRACVIDIRRDPALQSWMNDFFAYTKQNMEAVGQVDSDEVKKQREDLKRRWEEVADPNFESGRKWKEDAAHLRKELRDFEQRVEKDAELQAIRQAHAKFADDLQNTLFDTAATGMQLALDQASWIWQDVFNVYLPRIVGTLKDIPIPRTEFKDPETEFVLEDLDISSLSLLPGHVFIRNITDVDVTAPEHEETKTAVGSLTHIHAKAVQMQLKEVSFYYNDKTATVGPAEFSGLVEVTLPPQGVDVEVKVRLLPSTPEGLAQREQQKGFHRIEHVSARVHEDVSFSIKESNHPVIVSVFKPLFNARLRDALESVLTEQIRGAIETADALAWDIAQRAEVFADAGLGRGAALSAGLWSELGHMRKMPGGLLSGWRATGTGVVKDVSEQNAQIAMGAEPQVVSGEKRGPKGRLAEPLSERFGVDAGEAKGRAGGVAQQAKEGAKEGVRKVKSFKALVEEKKQQEETRPGWESSAFEMAQ